MDEKRIPLDVKAVIAECPSEGMHPAPDSPAYCTAAESQHGDATDARQILRRLLGWNLDENERNSLRGALETIDRIDSRACRTMRDDWKAANMPSHAGRLESVHALSSEDYPERPDHS